MKKCSWLFALLLALSLAFLGCPTDGGDPPPPPPPGNADPIDVEFTQAMLDVWGGGDIVAEGDGTGFTFTYGTGDNASHGNAVALFKVDLGEARVRDYEKVTFTFTGISGDIGPNTGQYDRGTAKGVNLLAAADKDDLKNFGGNDAGLVTYIVNPFTGTADGAGINAAGAKIGDQPATKDLELVIGPTRPQASNTGEVWFSIYLHASAKKWDSASAAATPEEKTSFKITNVTFVPHASAVGDVAVDEEAITGVKAPAAGGTPVTTITNTEQYTGTVTWAGALDADGKFVLDTVYTATITLAAKEGFTFNGVEADFFTVAGAEATNPANSGVVTAVFPATPAPPAGLTVEVGGVAQSVEVLGATGTEVELLDDGSGYIITYGTSGYGAAYAYFEVDFGAGKTLADYSKLTLKWKGTEGDIGWKPFEVFASSTPFTGSVVQSNHAATQSFQTANTTEQTGTFFLNAPSVTGQTAYIALTIWANNVASGTTTPPTKYEVYEIAFSEIIPDTITTLAIPGIAAPIAGVAPVTTVDTAQYSGTVVWAPAVTGTFATSQIYTATITLTAKAGYTLTGVAANSFTVAGTSTPATNAANSGVVTAAFPATGAAALTSFPITIQGDAAGATTSVDYTDVKTINATVSPLVSGYQVNETQGNNYTLTSFNINLGTGKTLADFGSITFTFEPVSGTDYGYKRIVMLAAVKDGLPTAQNFTSADYLVTRDSTSSDTAGQYGNQTESQGTTTPKAMTVYLNPPASTPGPVWEANEVQIAIWANMPTTTFKITNIVFVEAGPALPDVDVSIKEIPLGHPVAGGTPLATVETAQYTGAIEWSPAITTGDSFATSQVYTATITLVAKPGFTLDEITDEDFFTLTGATSITYDPDTKTVTVVFPETEADELEPLEITFEDDAVTEGVLKATGGSVVVVDNAGTGGDEKGYTFTRTATYGGAFASFKVPLPAGGKLSDYTSVTFTYTGVTGADIGNKKVTLLGWDETFTGSSVGSNAETQTGAATGVTVLYASSVNTGAGVTSFNYTMTGAATFDDSDEVWLCVYIHAGAGADYGISNIVLHP